MQIFTKQPENGKTLWRIFSRLLMYTTGGHYNFFIRSSITFLGFEFCFSYKPFIALARKAGKTPLDSSA